MRTLQLHVYACIIHCSTIPFACVKIDILIIDFNNRSIKKAEVISKSQHAVWSDLKVALLISSIHTRTHVVFCYNMSECSNILASVGGVASIGIIGTVAKWSRCLGRKKVGGWPPWGSVSSKLWNLLLKVEDLHKLLTSTLVYGFKKHVVHDVERYAMKIRIENLVC